MRAKPQYRANWETAKLWYKSRIECWCTFERASGIYTNSRTQKEFHARLMSSPSLRHDLVSGQPQVELYFGRPIIAVDKIAAKHILKKIKLGIWEDVRLLSDSSGGAVISGKTITVDIDQAIVDYAAWMDEQKNGIGQAKSESPAGGESPGAVQPGDASVGAVPENGSPSPGGLQPEHSNG